MTHTGSQNVISLSKVGLTFNHQGASPSIFHDFSLEVPQREFLCLVGRSGCGKSTLLNLISNSLTPSTGVVLVRASITIVPQSDLLIPWRTVLENVLLPAEIAHNMTKESVQNAHVHLEALGLKNCTELFPHQLSGGMRQKVSIARALLHDAELFLFDEPFSALDFDARLTAGRELRALIKQRSKSVVFVTHNIEEAIALGDRVVALGGRPASIRLDRRIDIEDTLRDPVNVRKAKPYPDLFEQIWRAVGEIY